MRRNEDERKGLAIEAHRDSVQSFGDTREKSASSPFATIILVIGIACLFSTLLIYSGTVISFLRFEGARLFVGTFAETTLLAGTLFGSLFLGLSLAGRKLPFMLFGAGGGAVHLCCALAFAHFSWFGSPCDALTVALSIAVAFGDTCLALAWGRICARFAIRYALVTVSLASMLSAGTCFLYAALPLPGTTALFVLCAIGAAIIPLAFADTECGDKRMAEQSESRAMRATMASLSDVIVAPGLGLLVFAFSMAVMRTSFIESQSAYLAALTLDAAALASYAGARKKRFTLQSGMHQTFLPLMAMVLLAATSISSSVGAGSKFVSFLTYALYALAAILTLSTLCAIAHAGEFSADLVFSTAVLLFCAASFAGQSFANVLGDDLVHVAVTVITTVYAFVMVLLPHMRRSREAHDETPTSGRPKTAAAPNRVPDRCSQLANEHSLTAREQEILLYLAEGHSGAYIADVLFISPNTARTHIHNIYRKLGVSSREDVLQLAKGDQISPKTSPRT